MFEVQQQTAPPPVGTGFDNYFFAAAGQMREPQVVDEAPAGVTDGGVAFLTSLFRYW